MGMSLEPAFPSDALAPGRPLELEQELDSGLLGPWLGLTSKQKWVGLGGARFVVAVALVRWLAARGLSGQTKTPRPESSSWERQSPVAAGLGPAQEPSQR